MSLAVSVESSEPHLLLPHLVLRSGFWAARLGHRRTCPTTFDAEAMKAKT